MTTTTHQMEDSGTTLSSSIINCEEAAEYSPFIFDILKKEKDKDGRGDNDNKVLVTRHLFPVIPGEVAAAGRTAAQWLNLSYGAAEPSNSRQELKPVQQKQQQQQVKKNRRGPRSRSSQYRGVTFYRRTSRWESHIWDCGKQVYLGGFDTAHAAARTYDRAAIKFRGVDADLNFNLSDYEEDMKQMKHLSKEEFVLILRPQSSGFARGSSKYRGVTLNKCSSWEASMGQLLGKNMAYDKAAIKYNGREAVTNFEPDAYQGSSSSYHNLDLSLGISQPSSIDPIHCDACEMANKERPLLLDSSTYASIGMHLHPLHGITMAPQNYEDRDKEKKRVQSVSSPRFANWAREMQNSNTGNIAPMPQLSNAASSGFCSSGRNMFLATPNSSNAINNSHFYNYRN